jgi:hypothetical protein
MKHTQIQVESSVAGARSAIDPGSLALVWLAVCVLAIAAAVLLARFVLGRP